MSTRRLTARKGKEFLFLGVVAVAARDLHAVRNQSRQQVAFVVEVTPDDGRLPRIVHQRCGHLAPFRHRAAPFLALFVKAIGWQVKEHALPCLTGGDDVLALHQWRQIEASSLNPRSDGRRIARAHELTQRQNGPSA
jgi:hypothetical protein